MVIRRKTLPFLGNSARIAPAHNNLIADGSLWKTFRESLLVSRKTFCVFHIFRLPYYRQDSRSKRRVRLYPRRQLLVGTKSTVSREEKKLSQRLDLFAFHLALSLRPNNALSRSDGQPLRHYGYYHYGDSPTFDASPRLRPHIFTKKLCAACFRHRSISARKAL